MKKVVAIMMALFLVVCGASFAACSEQGQGATISRVSVNDEWHVIVEYSDGTTQDLGYVDVEVPLYTVTFVDADGNVIDVQKVYKGKSATAPEAPEVQGETFSGWDTDFTNVQGDLTVKPLYGDMATFTVTFKDEAGNVLSTQKVVSGKAATAPTTPKRTDTVFDKWDKAFDKITEDTVVTAIYRAKRDVTVTFKDYNGLMLGTSKVREEDDATAPITPQREGYTFTGWSGSLTGVKSDTTVTAQYKLNGGDNIFDISYKVSGDTVTVELSLAGNVCLAGFEGELSFTGLTITTTEAKSTLATINAVGNTVKMTYSNATNVTKGETIFTVTLKATADAGKAELKITDCFDEGYNSVSYKVIGQNLKLK